VILLYLDLPESAAAICWIIDNMLIPSQKNKCFPSMLGSKESLTTANDIYLSGLKGTPAWMSPEVLTGRSVSPATDVYGLGLIFFEMMSAEKIFEGKTVKEVSIFLHQTNLS